MKRLLLATLLLAGATACATTSGKNLQPPVANKIPKVTEIHGERLVDDYAWLRGKEKPEVIEYLEAENAYADSQMGHTKALQKKLYDEMLHRIVEDDASAPYPKGDFFYYTRTESGKPYRIYCRKKGSLDAPEEVLLNVNSLAEGKEYVSVGHFDVSPDHNLLVYSVDETGAERYTIYVKDLRTGKVHAETIPNTYYSLAWANDNQTFFYVTVDDATRPWRAHRHVLGTPASEDVVVYQEDDDRFFLTLGRERSGEFVSIVLESAVTTEVRILRSDEPTGEFRVVEPRKQNIEYHVEHHGDRFFILTNEDAENFKLMEAPEDNPGRAQWQEVIPHSETVTLSGVLAFREHLVIYEREKGLPQLRVRKLASGEDHTVSFEEPSYDVWPDVNREFDTSTVRFGYTSLTTPRSVFDYDMESKGRELRKEEPVRDYDRSGYVTERLMAPAKDGVQVPVTVLRRKDTALDGSAPMLLNGYGSYGISYDPGFRSSWLSLVDRGFVIGIAHIRGGGEMGRRWKLDGKFEKKTNTFNDFIASAEELIRQKYTSADRLVIQGRSAGGLLMGAVTNLRPDLFKAVVAGVPFVDVINTMLDETIPLTVIEWEEWGNPNEEKAFRTIAAYSPYDNVEAKDYPSMLILAGLNDPRVAYWEPAKWAAKLRDLKTDNNKLLLKTNMGAGHGGASGRYGRLEETAFEYSYMLDQVGITK